MPSWELLLRRSLEIAYTGMIISIRLPHRTHLRTHHAHPVVVRHCQVQVTLVYWRTLFIQGGLPLYHI